MFSLTDILDGNEGSLYLHTTAAIDPAQVFMAVQHDSREVESGDLFIAIRGEHVDGHRFIAAAARAGAGAVLCAEAADDVSSDFLQIVVPDVVKALHAAARVRTRRQQNTTLIGITGSNGKTSTKEAVALVLARKAPTLKTYASYNNEIGYPLTLLRLETEHRYAVLEMGAQWVGELTWLCETIATPDWSIITNVGAAHLGYFGSQEQVAQAKSELVQVLAADGIAILNFDDRIVRGMSEVTKSRVLYYGREEGAEVRGTDVEGDALRGYAFTLRYHDQLARVQLHSPGGHSIAIALAAAAAGCAAGIALEEVGAALEEIVPAKGRCQIKDGPNGSNLIDDTYNANRQSIVAITQAMHNSGVAAGGKRWAVIGDIFELGQYAASEHRMSGEALVGVVDYLVAVGNEARYYVEGALQAGMSAEHIFYFAADVENTPELEEAKRAAAALLRERVTDADLVLVKGSRGMRMETMLDML